MAIFNSGFEAEDNDFDIEWSGKEGSPTVVAAAPAPHHGAKAMNADGAGDAAYKTFVNQTTVYIRLYWLFNGVPAEFSDFGDCLSLRNGATEIVRVRNRRGAGDEYQLTIRSEFPNQQSDSYEWDPIPDTYYCIEVKFVRHAVTGEYRLYLDGVERITRTGVDTTGVAGVDRIYVGAADWCSTYTGIDCVVVDSAYIGPEAAGGPTVKKGSNLSNTMTTMLNSKMLFSACNRFPKLSPRRF